MTESTTQTNPSEQKQDNGSCSSTGNKDKAVKTEAEKASCSTEHKQGSCGSKQ